MPTKDPRVGAYIEKAPDFAKPILTRLRTLAHKACPDVEETMKWRMPFFAHEGILFGMAAFKQHCSVHFWKGKLVLGASEQNKGFGNLGHAKALSDLPSDKILLGYIKK